MSFIVSHLLAIVSLVTSRTKLGQSILKQVLGPRRSLVSFVLDFTCYVKGRVAFIKKNADFFKG